ncbi:MAG: protein kinase domain-containing protein, partial [Gemmiger formicilis]|uniref:protein kinase domain-containing protein n=1 Tax=Gemmiger formicilis TaxID=745368 RepID=UPI0039945923
YYARIKAEKSREIELLVNLKSPHIVHINEFDAVEEPDHSAFYLLIRMDLLQALTAFRVDHLTDTPEQAGAYARKVTLDICDALRVCHENGICHRDIKPANILYGATGDFYLGFRRVAVRRRRTLVVSHPRYAAPSNPSRSSRPPQRFVLLGLVLS